MFIHRPEYYQVYQDEYGNDLRGITELYIEKNLNGHRHRIRLKSNYDIASFESVQIQNLSFDTDFKVLYNASRILSIPLRQSYNSLHP